MAAYDNVAMPGAPAAPSYAAPLLDFSPIANLADKFYQGAEQKRAYDLSRAFQNGIPRSQDGTIDYAGMADTLARKGGVDQALQAATTGAQMQASRDNAALQGGGQPQPQPRPTAPVFAPPPQQQPQPKLSSMGTDNNGADTVRSVMTETFGGRDVSASIPSIAKRFGIEPDAPLTPQQVAQLKPMLSQAQGRMPQQQQPQAAPIAPQQQTPSGDLSGLAPPGWKYGLPAYRDALARSVSNPLTSQNDRAVNLERMKAIDGYLAKEAERTPGQKEANDPLVAQHAGAVETEKKVAEANAKVIGGAIDAGHSAQKRIQSLGVMKDALTRGEGNITTGPFAEFALRGKQAIGSLFNIDVSGTSEGEVAHKIGFQLASQAVKEISNRPTQFEFAKALENNPGILLSPKGSKFMIDVMGQSARHDIDLAKLAQDRKNWNNWQDVQDKFYQTHPIMSPFDRKRPLSEKDLSVLSEGAPQSSGAAPQQGTAPSFSSPSDIAAAIKAGTVKAGDRVQVPGGFVTVKGAP